MQALVQWIKLRAAVAALFPVLAVAPLIALVRFAWCVVFNPAKAWRIAVGFDQLVNVAANGSEDETISSRAGRAAQEGRVWGCVLCSFLNIFERDHCDKSIGV